MPMTLQISGRMLVLMWLTQVGVQSVCTLAWGWSWESLLWWCVPQAFAYASVYVTAHLCRRLHTGPFYVSHAREE
jgi:hypothetical protein